jgi:hypothetical protein
VKAARNSKLTQYRVRASFGEAGIEQVLFFLWARSKTQALRTVREVAPKIEVVEVERIGKLVPVDDVPRPTKVPAESGPVVPRFFEDSWRGSPAPRR